MQSTARSIECQRSLPRSLAAYILVEHIARGGMADVYLARGEDGRLVVVKQVLPELREAPRYDDLLLSEAKLVTLLKHSNVARATDSGRDEEGAPYAAFEYVEGIDMRQMLRLCSRRKIALPVATSLYLIRELLRGLDHAHRARDERGNRLDVVHRDVTPSNVLMSFDGDVKLCDFGIASATVMPAVPADYIEGKTGYMSPEQAMGEDLDKRSDIYAVGIMLWELLAGRRLRPKKGTPALRAARRGEVPPMRLNGLPHEKELLAIVHRALARDRSGRYSSAGAMRRDLDSYCELAAIDISAVDLALWLERELGDERALAAERRVRAHATALEMRDSIYGADPLPESGVRLIDGPPSHQLETAPAARQPRRRPTLVWCTVAFVVGYLLTALGIF
jgi:serine/threonine-protein kinase